MNQGTTTTTIQNDSARRAVINHFINFSENTEHAKKRARTSSPSEWATGERTTTSMPEIFSAAGIYEPMSLTQKQVRLRDHLLKEQLNSYSNSFAVCSVAAANPASAALQKRSEALNIHRNETERATAGLAHRLGQAPDANMGAGSAAVTYPHFLGDIAAASFHSAPGIPVGSNTNKIAELMRLRAMLGYLDGTTNRPESTFSEPTPVSSTFHHGLMHQQAQLEALLALQAQSRAAQNIQPFHMPPAVASSNRFTASTLSFSPAQALDAFPSMAGSFADAGLPSLVRNSSGNMIPSAAGFLDASVCNIRNHLQHAFSGSGGLARDPAVSPKMLVKSEATPGARQQHDKPTLLPRVLATREDDFKLSSHQVFLRHQIEVFQATEEDTTTHTRGRNKPITLGQVGIRCRHCAHIPVSRRQKGSTYFPASLLGLYQAAQNMSTTHMQCGLCTEMPLSAKQQFAQLLSNRSSSSGAGRPYWAKAAAKIGLVDSEDGIRLYGDILTIKKDTHEKI